MLAAGDTAPDFALQDVQARPVQLKDLVQERPALVVFFKVGCPVCQMTLPYVERLAKSTSISLLAISQDDAESTEEFRKEFGVTFTTALDPKAKAYRVSSDYGIETVPSLFLVEPGCQIAMAWSGWSKRDMQALGQVAGIEPFEPGERVPDWRGG